MLVIGGGVETGRMVQIEGFVRALCGDQSHDEFGQHKSPEVVLMGRLPKGSETTQLIKAMKKEGHLVL